MRYFIWLSYDGTNYHGWQSQPNGITVQSELERCLSLLLRQLVSVTGAGRTDTGVHARQMAAHFDIDELPMRLEDLTYKLNGLLPHDIAIDRIELVQMICMPVSRLPRVPIIIMYTPEKTLSCDIIRWNCTISWTMN